MARSMWRGAIQFGLVTIPVKLYLATESRGGLSFNLLHKTSLAAHPDEDPLPGARRDPALGNGARLRVRQGPVRRHRRRGLRERPAEDRPLDRDRDVRRRLARLAGANFVKQAYYLEPEPIGRKAFYLLKTVLADEGLSAICKIVLKDREALAALNPYSKTMLLTTLYWPDEVRSIDELDLPDEDIRLQAGRERRWPSSWSRR